MECRLDDVGDDRLPNASAAVLLQTCMLAYRHGNVWARI